ncbi:MAG: T9SS type A sorting domain-containing protein [Sporocytophaga sp.]|nr:T9SS type A sorting domain-containing protein [Sporocytophaga sp.]
MKLYKLFVIGMFVVFGFLTRAKAQGISLSVTPNSCNSSGVTVTATVTSLPSNATGVYWSINDFGITFCHNGACGGQDLRSRTYTFTQSGIYTFKCYYTGNGNYYTSDPIDISVYSNNLEVCGNYFSHFNWSSNESSTWWSGNYISTCSTGVQVQGVETDPDFHTQLYMKANNSVTLSPGFVAETGTIVEARIASNCSANTSWSTTYSSMRNGIVEMENTGSTSIFPNPTSGSFALNLNYSTLKNVDVVVSDLTGNVVYNTKLGYVDSANLNIDLSNKEPGLYLVKIISDSKTEVKKVVVSR